MQFPGESDEALCVNAVMPRKEGRKWQPRIRFTKENGKFLIAVYGMNANGVVMGFEIRMRDPAIDRIDERVVKPMLRR